jgi:hypothetical protein
MESVIEQRQTIRNEVHGSTPYEWELTAPSLSGTLTVARQFTMLQNTVTLQSLGPKAISVPSYGVFR